MLHSSYMFLVFAISLLFSEFAYEMAWSGRFHAKNNHDLIQHLKSSRIIKSDRVYEAMSSVDRGNYTCSGYAYIDSPQDIGYGATISAPHMHAYALEILEDKLCDGARALDVGSGSGYLTACMAMMLGTNGLAIGIEHISELKAFAMQNIQRDNPELLESGRVQLVVGDGRLGYPEKAPYDAIHVGAAAKEMPQALIDQLAPGGRLVLPVGPRNSDQVLVQVDKTKDGKIKKKSLTGVVFVPLTSKDKQHPS
ncbi:protein-L-isoaspartate(D-aspartate) O-methyltransferase-like isoform X1 [Bombus affinis]|uniref:protein-L-isoaspartate(D-aspartate) O-methyltransferase-like isoform X1 n=2 Tax=Bombus TaxID=28641 RepID=UPI0021B77E32|nr:protein-L-isoaspartate(D-aspartate) O-methyltransferase-like isoform X1 [Bombus affinis]